MHETCSSEKGHNSLTNNKTNKFSHGSKFHNKEKEVVPITVKRDWSSRPNYYVLAGSDAGHGLPGYENIDVLGDTSETMKIKQRPDYLTQVYVASITVVGLYVFFRLLQKTK